jgi:DNA replication and repair protein RecF
LVSDEAAVFEQPSRRALAAVAASAEQVLVTAAVAEEIPDHWDARQVIIGSRDDDSGRVSVVQT